MAIVDQERVNNLYNVEDYSSNTNDWEDSASVFRAKALYSSLAEAGVCGGIKSVLDVGCGSGGVLISLSKHYSKGLANGKALFRGVDISPKAIAIANRLYPDASNHGVSFRVGDLREHAEREKYSLVSLIHVLEHCPDMLEMLKVCESRAEYIYVNVPIEANLLYVLRRGVLLNQYLAYGHVHFFNEPFFLRWLENNGFEVMSVVYSEDFKINKKGVAYNLFRFIRLCSGKILGPAFTTWMFGGYSLGVLVRSRRVSKEGSE